MADRISISGYTGWIIVVFSVFYVKFSFEQNISSTTVASRDNSSIAGINTTEIDYETLSQFGVTHDFAELFRLNLLKAIEAVKEQEGEPLRQGEFGGVSGGFYQGGGGQGGGGFGGGGAGGQEEEDEEEDDGPMTPVTPGPGAFGVLSGLFGIFSGLGSLSPSRIIQSTVNFFPPGQRMQAQMIVDTLIGYTPPENRTVRPRPRTRRTTTTPLPVMMAETTTLPVEAKGNDTEVMIIEAKVGEEGNGTSAATMSTVTESTTTSEPDFINVHEILNRTTIPPPALDEDDEVDLQKRENVTIQAYNSSSYKIKPKATPEDVILTSSSPASVE